MKKLLLLTLIFLANITIAQETKVFELDLGAPTKNSLKVIDCNSKSNSLDIKTKQLIALKLVNANPFKYNYEINYELIDFFKEDLKSPFKEPETEIESASQPEKSESEKINKKTESKNQEQIKNLSEKQKLETKNELLIEQRDFILKEKKEVEDISYDEKFQITSENTFLRMNVEKLKEEQKKIILEFDDQIVRINSSIERNNKLIKKGNINLSQLKKQEEEERKSREITNELNKKKIELLKQSIIIELQVQTENTQDLYFKLDNYLQIIAAEDYLDKVCFKS